MTQAGLCMPPPQCCFGDGLLRWDYSLSTSLATGKTIPGRAWLGAATGGQG